MRESGGNFYLGSHYPWERSYNSTFTQRYILKKLKDSPHFSWMYEDLSYGGCCGTSKSSSLVTECCTLIVNW